MGRSSCAFRPMWAALCCLPSALQVPPRLAFRRSGNNLPRHRLGCVSWSSTLLSWKQRHPPRHCHGNIIQRALVSIRRVRTRKHVASSNAPSEGAHFLFLELECTYLLVAQSGMRNRYVAPGQPGCINQHCRVKASTPPRIEAESRPMTWRCLYAYAALEHSEDGQIEEGFVNLSANYVVTVLAPACWKYVSQVCHLRRRNKQLEAVWRGAISNSRFVSVPGTYSGTVPVHACQPPPPPSSSPPLQASSPFQPQLQPPALQPLQPASIDPLAPSASSPPATSPGGWQAGGAGGRGSRLSCKQMEGAMGGAISKWKGSWAVR